MRISTRDPWYLSFMTAKHDYHQHQLKLSDCSEKRKKTIESFRSSESRTDFSWYIYETINKLLLTMLHKYHWRNYSSIIIRFMHTSANRWYTAFSFSPQPKNYLADLQKIVTGSTSSVLLNHQVSHWLILYVLRFTSYTILSVHK